MKIVGHFVIWLLMFGIGIYLGWEKGFEYKSHFFVVNNASNKVVFLQEYEIEKDVNLFISESENNIYNTLHIIAGNEGFEDDMILSILQNENQRLLFDGMIGSIVNYGKSNFNLECDYSYESYASDVPESVIPSAEERQQYEEDCLSRVNWINNYGARNQP